MRLEDVTFVAVDLETTGLDVKRDEIIAFAAVPIIGMKIMVGEARYLTICPEKYKIDSMKYHGISAEELKGSPCFAEAAHHILEALNGILVGYCVDLDYRFLRRFFMKQGIEFERKVIDIAPVEKWIVDTYGKRDDKELGFDALIKRYGLKDYYRHNALSDAFYSAQIFQLQAMMYNIETLPKLMEVMRIGSFSDCNFVF